MATESVPLTSGEQMFKIGLNRDCPVHHIDCGGQRFVRTSEKVTGYGAQTERSKLQGAVVRMQEGQMEAVRQSAKHKIIRSTRGKKARSRVHDIRSKQYRKMPGDLPVAQFLYAIPLTEMENPYNEPLLPTLGEAWEKEAEAKAAQAAQEAASQGSSPGRKRNRKD